MADAEERPHARPEARGIDGLLLRYSRWKTGRLITMDETPLSALALQTLYLSACVLADGVILPWIVTLLVGEFSFLGFALLLLPALAVESMFYRKMRFKPRDAT